MKSSLGIKSSFKFKKKKVEKTLESYWNHSFASQYFHLYYFYNNNKMALVNFVVYNITRTVYEFTHL